MKDRSRPALLASRPLVQCACVLVAASLLAACGGPVTGRGAPSGAGRAGRAGELGRGSDILQGIGALGPASSQPLSSSAGSPPPLRVRAPTAILVDLRTGAVLFAKHPDQRRPVASVVKIMTAMLVLERARLSDVVGVSRGAARAAPTRLGLEPRERITVGDLLWGLLLWSGNDASVALAEHVSGSLSAFKALMNARAHALGLRDTYFAGPSGLDDRGYSTVRDVAVLARAALRNPVFARIVSTRRHWIPGPARQIHRLRNLNDLLRTYRGAVGVKTGYTQAAGNCVVGAATRGRRSLLAVVLGDPARTRWRAAYADVRRLLDYGFAATALALSGLGTVAAPVRSPLPA